VPAEETDAKEESTVPAEDDKKLSSTAEVDAQRERRRQFDEEWNDISEILSTVPLEPLVVSVSTKPDDNEPEEPLLPRTTDEMTDEILENLNSTFDLS